MRSSRRTGVAYVLAMLYVLLFTVLSIGFFAASTLSMQIARNDRSAADAQSAAESGMQFARQQLGRIDIPESIAERDLLRHIAEQLGQSLNATGNMKGHSVGVAGNIIYLPAPDEFLTIDRTTGTEFQVQIAVNGPEIWVKTIGRGQIATIARAIQMRFARSPRAGNEQRVSLTPLASTYEEVSP